MLPSGISKIRVPDSHLELCPNLRTFRRSKSIVCQQYLSTVELVDLFTTVVGLGRIYNGPDCRCYYKQFAHMVYYTFVDHTSLLPLINTICCGFVILWAACSYTVLQQFTRFRLTYTARRAVRLWQKSFVVGVRLSVGRRADYTETDEWSNCMLCFVHTDVPWPNNNVLSETGHINFC